MNRVLSKEFMKIFNVEKTADQYGEYPLFFGSPPGLFDTVNKRYPKIWALYKEMKSLDWDEAEFDYGQCNIDFKTCDPAVKDMMIKTLAWQWEADSVASRSIAPVLAPFITNSELWAAWQRISDNEVIHAATYSEIVRMSFDDPNEVMSEILSVKESIARMSTVNAVFAAGYEASHQYALGLIPYSQELYNKLYTVIATLLMLERIQFMASFAITFTICGTGLFQPIGKAVQKIAQDELEVHVQLDKEVLFIEQQTERGNLAKLQTRDQLNKIFTEVINSEFSWLDYLFADGKSLLGTNKKLLKQWVAFNAKDVLQTLDLDIPAGVVFPKENPMPHLESWLNMNKTQSAPMEQDNGAYKVGVVINDDNSKQFDVDF